MRLKEIKPGMVIHCKNKNEIKEISDTGVVGINGGCITEYMVPECYVIIRKKYADWSLDKNVARKFGNIVEFSDLIIPELTAEEAVEWLAKNYNNGQFYDAFGDDCTMDCLLDDGRTPEDIVNGIIKYKQEHEKSAKEPEIETVDICRIFKITASGFRTLVHEEEFNLIACTLATSHECVEKILKRYCMEHEGEFIAVHEVVSRVKR